MNKKMKKILIFAPHPDDELINAGAKIIEEEQNNNLIYIIYVTCGSIKKDNYASIRKKAVKSILVNARLIFLDYLEKELLEKKAFEEALKKISELLKKIKPDEIYIPAYEGGHVDHDLTHLLVVKSTKKKIFEYPTYNNYFTLSKCLELIKNKIKKLIFLPVFEKKQFIPKKIPVICIGSKNTIDKKNKMIEKYIKIVSGKSVETHYGQDMFREVKNYDYTKPPHIRFPFKLRYETSCNTPFRKLKEAHLWK